MLSRRKLLLAPIICAPALLLRSKPALAGDPEQTELKGVAPAFEGTPIGFAPGDYGYHHERYHPAYQKLFGILGKCSCGDGDCRATVWRYNSTSPWRYDILVERDWYPITGSTWMPDDSTPVPAELFEELAHVCAYPAIVNLRRTMNIACALINKKTT